MDTRDLTLQEQLVFIGLVKLIVHADQVVSAEEQQVLETLQQQLGPATWNDRVREAAIAFPTIQELEQAAREVDRKEAQQLIHDILVEIAGADVIIPEEAHVLQWVYEAGGLEETDGSPASGEAESDEDEGPIDSFELFHDDS